MKFICMQDNYSNAATSGNEQPVFFFKPETALLRSDHPFFLPYHAQRIIPRINIALKISRNGKHIQENFAHLYYSELACCVDLEAIDTLKICRQKQLPWENAKAFDGSAPTGSFIPLKKIADLYKLPFSMKINEIEVISSNTCEMILSFEKIISYISNFVSLKMGDIIMTGGPEQNHELQINDKVECFLGTERNLIFRVK